MKEPVDLLKSKAGRATLATALYFSEGAPIGFIWWALPVLLRRAGVDLITISSLVALLVLPWMLKFLWAPLVDVFRGPRWGFKHWIVSSQLVMAAALVPLLFLSPAESAGTWLFFLALHSFAASLQDASIDAMIIQVVSKAEVGMLNGWMQAGMLTGRSLFGGLSLVVAAHFGTHAVLAALIGSILVTLVLLWFVREPLIRIAPGQVAAFWKNLAYSFSRRNTIVGILFALTAGAAFETAGGLSGTFLTDRGVSQQTVGYFFGLPVVISMLAGGLAGGRISDRMERRKAVGWFGAGFVAVVGIISATGTWMPEAGHAVFIALFIVLYFFIGLFTASSYALFMEITDRRTGATQFSTYMAATNACESWTMWLAGIIASLSGYPIAFAVMCGVSLAGMVLLRFIRPSAEYAGAVSVPAGDASHRPR